MRRLLGIIVNFLRKVFGRFFTETLRPSLWGKGKREKAKLNRDQNVQWRNDDPPMLCRIWVRVGKRLREAFCNHEGQIFAQRKDKCPMKGVRAWRYAEYPVIYQMY